MIDKALIEALKRGDAVALKTVYIDYKSSFIGFARSYPLDEHLVIDVYQDAIIALRENAINGKLDTLKCSLKTYMFGIGKFMIYKKLNEQKKLHLVKENTEFENLTPNDDFTVDLVEQLTEDQKKLQMAFRELGPKCKAILTLFYYRGFTIEEITKELNYTNKDVAKSQKSRCMKSLKALIFNN